MNARQFTQRNMILVVDLGIQNVSPVILDKMPSFNPVYQELQQTITLIDKASQQQSYSRKGFTVDKKDQRKAMTIATMNVLLCIKAFAIHTQNQPLFQEVNRPISYINKATDQSARDFCKFIHNKATQLATALQPFGLDTADLTTLQTTLQAFTKLIPKPRYEIVARKQTTNDLKSHLANAMQLLHQMDTFVAALRYKEPEFYRAYFDSRRQIDNGSRKIPLKGNITNTEGQPLSGVKIAIPALKLEKQSTSKGNYQLRRIPPGIYQVTFTLQGFEPFKTRVAIVANQTTTNNINLTPSRNLRMTG